MSPFIKLNKIICVVRQCGSEDGADAHKGVGAIEIRNIRKCQSMCFRYRDAPDVNGPVGNEIKLRRLRNAERADDRQIRVLRGFPPIEGRFRDMVSYLGKSIATMRTPLLIFMRLGGVASI